MRKKLLFKIRNEVIVEETTELFLDQIDKLKRVIAEECSCHVDDIDVEMVTDGKKEYSDFDVNENGMFFWEDYDRFIKGISTDLVIGSDEYLDAIIDGTILDKIIFI